MRGHERRTAWCQESNGTGCVTVVAGSQLQTIHYNAFILNSFTCFHSETKCQLVVWKCSCWDYQRHFMLLIHLISIIQVHTLCYCVTMPANAISIAIQWYTHTLGVHLTKVNLSTTNTHKDLVLRIPIIKLEYIELDIEKVSLHWHLLTACRHNDRNRHLAATSPQKTQKIGEVVLIKGCVTVRARNLVVIPSKHPVHFALVAWTSSPSGSKRGHCSGGAPDTNRASCGGTRWCLSWECCWCFSGFACWVLTEY